MPKLVFGKGPNDTIIGMTATDSTYRIVSSEAPSWPDVPDVLLADFTVFGPEGTVRLDEFYGQPDLPLGRVFSLDLAKALCQAHYDAGSPDIDPCPVFKPETHEQFADRCLEHVGRGPDGLPLTGTVVTSDGPGDFVFGVQQDGEPLSINFRHRAEAETFAKWFVEDGVMLG